MNVFQKIIKYGAIAFGLYLAITIISIIVGVVLTISTGVFGVQMIAEQSDIEKVDVTQEFEQFSRLDLEINSSNLTIKTEGEVFKIEASQIPSTTNIENKNGTLEIKETKKLAFSKDAKITIYIPNRIELEEIKLEMGAGTVEMNNIISNKVDFNFGVGSVTINQLISNDADIECGAGEVIIEDVDLSNANIGTGVGKLVYSGFMRGESEVNCGIGEVDISLEGGSEIYKIDAEKGIGDIRINDTEVANKSVTGNGENRIEIDGGIGSIEIKM